MNKTLCARRGEQKVRAVFKNYIMAKQINDFSQPDAFIGLDSVDFKSRMTIGFTLSKCQDAPNVRTRNRGDRRGYQPPHLSRGNTRGAPSVSRRGRNCFNERRGRRVVRRCGY